MRKKALLVVSIWIVVAVAMFVLYLLREVSPVKESVAWALSVWPILATLGGVAILISGWVIKHDFGSKSRQIIVGPTTVGTVAKPEIMIEVGRTQIIKLEGNMLVEVSTMIHTSLPTNIGSLRLEVGGRYLDEHPEPRIGHRRLGNISGNAWFVKPSKGGGRQKARLWLNANGREWVSDEFTIDFDQQPELRK